MVLVCFAFLAILAVPAATGLRQACNVTALTTFYGAKDNCPPGGDIAHPIKHQLAGGTGTYADPITYAGATQATPPGTIIYVYALRKYFIMEDDCEECQKDWRKNKWHVDLWMGPDTVSPGPNLIACENALTQSQVRVLVDAPPNLPVNTAPLFANNKCIVPAPPCHDQGNQCGNSCQIPKAATCTQLASLFALNMTRFVQLNPRLPCTRTVPAGTSVCMGGTCGD